MRKLVSLLTVLLLLCTVAFGQTRTVTGTVKSSNGGPIPFATITENGTKNAATADANGFFTITIKAGSKLTVSSVGHESFVLTPGEGEQTITLKSGGELTEVTVTTALGVKREKRALSYATQTVTGENLTYSNNVDIANALAGKVAGVKLVGSPSSTFDNANIIIRGPKGFGLTSPLYVLDGNIVGAELINMENVEDVSVLKGGAATALYGQRATNGVIMLTSKKGKRGVSNTIELKTGVAFEKLGLIPNYQDEYAGGYSSSLSNPNQYGGYMDDKGWYKFYYDPSLHPASWAAWDGQNILEYGADESWGPRIDGTQYRPWYSWYTNHPSFGKTEAIAPQPDNVRDFFQTGRTLSNSIAFTTSSDRFNSRFSYANQDRTLILSNSKRQLHQLGFNGEYDVTRRIKLITDIQYSYDERRGQPFETYRNDGLNITQNFNQWFERQLDIKMMKDFQYGPDGRVTSWNIGDPNFLDNLTDVTTPQYWDNPWWVQANSFQTSLGQRLSMNVGIQADLSDLLQGLRFDAHARRYSLTSRYDIRKGTGGLETDYFETGQTQNSENNYDASLSYKKKIGQKITVDAMAGVNVRKNYWEDISQHTNGGLSVPNYFNINASKDKATYSNSVRQQEVYSQYARATFGYGGWIYVDGSVRRDQSSTLPPDQNSFTYPSVGTSIIFTEFLKGTNFSKILTFGKVRYGFAQVGSDIGFSQVYTGLTAGVPFAGTPLVTYDNTLRNGDIKPALQTSNEVGLELKFFNKLGVDFTYYQNDNTEQILDVDVSTATGYSAVQINAGKIVNKGWELVLSYAVTKNKDWSWDASFNIAHSSNKLVALARGLTSYLVGTTWNDTRLEHRVGEEWGKIIGRRYNIDPKNGKVIIGTNGVPTYTTGNEIEGNVLPEYTGGFTNMFRYKFIDLSFNIDFQSGGMFFSTTRMFNLGTGLSQETIGTNDKGKSWRDFPSLGGGYKMEGSDGNGNDRVVYIPARRYFYSNLQRDVTNFLYDASYVKLREIRLGFTLPANIASKIKAKTINLSTFVTNPWLIYAESKEFGIDPSELETSWSEGGQLTQTRQYGATLKFIF